MVEENYLQVRGKDFTYKIIIQHPKEVQYMQQEDIFTKYSRISTVYLTARTLTLRSSQETSYRIILQAAPSYTHPWCL